MLLKKKKNTRLLRFCFSQEKKKFVAFNGPLDQIGQQHTHAQDNFYADHFFFFFVDQ